MKRSRKILFGPTKSVRRLNACENFPNWKDKFNDTCVYYEDNGCDLAVTWANENGTSAKHACCTCQGGLIGGTAHPTTITPTKAPTTDAPTSAPTILAQLASAQEAYKSIKRSVKSAPANNSASIIYISAERVLWDKQIVIKNGQHIVLIGKTVGW